MQRSLVAVVTGIWTCAVLYEQLNNIRVSVLRRAMYGCPVTVVLGMQIRAMPEEDLNHLTMSLLRRAM